MNLGSVVTVPVSSGNTISNANAVKQDYSDFGSSWDHGNIFTDWIMHRDTQAHNDMLNTMAFNANEAEKAREFERIMSNTQMQRKVADYLRAGFSPLAALEGNGSYQVSSAPAASASASGSRGGNNNLGTMFGALMMTIATFATKGIATAANASKAALDSQKLELLKEQVEVQKGWLDLAKNGNKGAAAIVAEKTLRQASHGHTSPKIDWDKLLDDLDKY